MRDVTYNGYLKFSTSNNSKHFTRLRYFYKGHHCMLENTYYAAGKLNIYFFNIG